MRGGMQVECQIDRVLDFCDDDTTEYTILSHWWIDNTEISYDKMVGLANMGKGEKDAIWGGAGYKRILDTCRQVQKHSYEWVWVDTCCIDKWSSAELLEAINLMYCWYKNTKVCYVYLHDVDGSFPTQQDATRYPRSNGWPEWFLHEWTLQEMIALSDVQFFNKNWQHIGDKKTLAWTLTDISQVPMHILRDGIDTNWPCIAWIISWAANWTMMWVEDRAYSLMDLLDVNMPMLYEEGRKAFHHLQLEIIWSTNNQSIFAWGWNSCRVCIGSIPANDPSFFEDCGSITLMGHHEFIWWCKNRFLELSSMDTDLHCESKCIFQAYLPCLNLGLLVTIDLVLWNSNYYQYLNVQESGFVDSPEFCQVYLWYQDTPNYTVTFEVGDSDLTKKGFTCSNKHPEEHIGNTFTLTNANSFCLRTYSEEQGDCYFKVLFGQCLGWYWVHLDNFPLGTAVQIDLETSILQGPDWVLSISDIHFYEKLYGELWVHTSISLDHLGSCGPTVFCGRDQRLEFELRYFMILISRMDHITRKCTLLKWVIFLCIWVINMIIHRDSVILCMTQGVSCCSTTQLNCTWIDGEFLEIDGHWMLFSLADEGTKVSMHLLRTLFVLIV